MLSMGSCIQRRIQQTCSGCQAEQFVVLADALLLQSERESVLPSVKAILSAFKEKKGLRYSDDDLRWRHLGMRDGKVYLFDLGSLEADDPKKPDVDHQIGQLRAKMN